MRNQGRVFPQIGQIDALEPRRLLAFVADGAFGADGILRYDAPDALATSIDVIATSDGKVLIGGSETLADPHPYLARLNANGTPDTGFSAVGHLTLPDSLGEGVNQIVPLTGGKYLVAGTDAVARVTAGGNLDTSFSGDGVASVTGSIAAIDPSGAIFTVDGTQIRKFNADGSLATSWATNGIFDLSTHPATTDLIGGATEPTVLVRIAPGNRVMIAFDATDDSGLGEVGILRLNADGEPHTTFSTDGVTTLPNIGAQTLADVLVLPDTQTLILYNGEGSLNALYGLSGTGNPKPVLDRAPELDALAPLSLRSPDAFADEASRLAMLPDGSPIIVGGFADTEDAVTYTAVMKLNGDFGIDTTFSIDADAIATADPRVATTDGLNGLGISGATADDAVYTLIRTGAGNVGMKLSDDPTGEFGISRFGNSLTVSGTDAADRIGVGSRKGRIVVSIGGDRASFLERGGQFLTVNGNGGDDQITLDPSLVARSLQIEAGAGNDRVDAFDTLFAGTTRRIFAGDGEDLVRVATAPTVVYGEAGRDSLFGSSAADALFGGDANDLLVGGSGNDYIEGNAGNDILDASAGNDRLSGGSGNDVLLGGKGNDTLAGQSGNDTLIGGVGADYMDAGPGDDRLEARDNTRDQLFGGGDADLGVIDLIDARDGIETIDVVSA